MELIFLLLLAYFVGSIPFGLLITKMAGLGDVRDIGSGSIGATNVLRTGSKKLAALTLLMDAAKGGVAVFLGQFFLPVAYWGCGDVVSLDESAVPCNPSIFTPSYYYISLGLAAIIGHCYPVWLKFKGGKGVATAAGVLLVATPYVGLICCLAWLLCAFVSRISSLSALVTAAIAPIAAYFLYGYMPALVCLLIAVLIFYKHKDNIKRLLSGTEPKIGAKK